MIGINPMPDRCGECYLLGTDGKILWCPLLLDEHNDCVEIYHPIQRLDTCPLQPIILCRECARWKTYLCIVNDYAYSCGVREIHCTPPDFYCANGEAK